MPNHIHGIIVVGAPLVGAQRVGMRATIGGDIGAGTDRGATAGADSQAGVGVEARATTRVAPTELGNVVGAYKSLTTVEYVRGVKTLDWPPFHRRLWQRNYYEHIVRDAESMGRIRQYIADNASQWPFDYENPTAVSPNPGRK